MTDSSLEGGTLAVVLNYNSIAHTLRCVASLLSGADQNLAVAVIDNGSDGDEASQLRRRLSSSIAVTAMDRNLGFAAGANVGLEEARRRGAEFVLFLNNDAILEDGALARLREHIASDPGVAAVGPKVSFAERPGVIACVGGGAVDLHFGRTPSLGYRQLDEGQFDAVTDVAWIAGTAMLARVDALCAVDGFDESFFFGLEDVDLGLRLTLAGYRLVAAPEAHVLHIVGGSSTPVLRVEHWLRGYLLLMRKHGRARDWLTFLPFFLFVRIPLEARRTILRDPVGTATAVLRAIVWNLRHAAT